MCVCVYMYVCMYVCIYVCMFSMDSLMPLVCAFLFLIIISLKHSNAAADDDVPFEQNFDILYGGDRTQLLNQNKTIRISIDDHSGSGFRSKQKYGSGLFHMRIKLLPPKDSTGVITTFYIISDSSDTRDEIDFEFLGNNNTQSYILHTNVVVKGNLNRAQEIILWFDPTASFHDYKLLWNQHQIVFFVDDTPVRVFKNVNGLAYPTKPMHIECTIWNATWASQGKLVDWSQGPFEAFYEGFGVDGCSTQSSDPDQECYSTSNPQYYWNQQNYWALNASQQLAYEAVRNNSPLVYDYCNVINKPQPPECKFNQ